MLQSILSGNLQSSKTFHIIQGVFKHNMRFFLETDVKLLLEEKQLSVFSLITTVVYLMKYEHTEKKSTRGIGIPLIYS
jgi:hypothetical protein